MQPSKHKALGVGLVLVRYWASHRRRWPSIGPALSQRLVFAGSVDRPHCDSHIDVVLKKNNKFRLIQSLRPVRVVNDSCCKVKFQCEDKKTVAQLIEPKDDLVTVD